MILVQTLAAHLLQPTHYDMTEPWYMQGVQLQTTYIALVEIDWN